MPVRHLLFFILILSTTITAAFTQQLPPQEKIFAHTDKDFYVAGEILWFKLYDVSVDSLKPVELSNIAYVEILNANQKPVLQATVPIKNGSGNGSFYLPSSVTSGNYILRAYTNWMKNFGAETFFQKNIVVVNTLTPVVNNMVNDSTKYNIDFFPESGNLVQNIESKVGFKATDIYGNSVDCSGRIINEANETVTSFSTLKFGMGSFNFMPQANHNYSAIVNINGRSIKKNIPDILSNGFVMHVANNNDNITVSVNTNSSNQQAVYLVAYNNNKTFATLTQALNNNQTTFNISKKDLPAGINRITIFDGNKHPVCERLLFSRPAALSLNLSSDKNSYSTRNEIKLNITAPENSNLSMAVYKVDSLQTEDENTILNYLWFSSYLHGNVQSPQYYFSNSEPLADSALENLLLTQGWSKFKQDSIQTSSLKFAPEIEGHIVQGKVTDKTAGLPAKNVRVYASIPGKYFHFASAVSNENGDVFFDMKDAYGPGELIIQTAKEDSMYRVEITDAFSDQTFNSAIAPFKIGVDKLSLLSSYNLSMQIQNAYTINKLNTFAVPALDSNAFYGKPGAQYYLDNYTRFNTMEEVLREYIVGVNVHIKQSNYSLAIVDSRNNIVFDKNPLVLVDGVPIFDMNKVIAYNPLKIKKADVVYKKFYINSLTADGILSYATYNGDLDGYQFDPSTIELSYEGLQLQREFYSPQYVSEDQIKSRLPDYRNVLYWSPQVNTSGISFYTSDIKGNYIAVLQGIDANGKAGYATAKFEVK